MNKRQLNEWLEWEAHDMADTYDLEFNDARCEVLGLIQEGEYRDVLSETDCQILCRYLQHDSNTRV